MHTTTGIEVNWRELPFLLNLKLREGIGGAENQVLLGLSGYMWAREETAVSGTEPPMYDAIAASDG